MPAMRNTLTSAPSINLLPEYKLYVTVVDHLTIGVGEIGKKFTIVTLCNDVVEECISTMGEI